jgi:phage terminase large subunit-like protein
VEAGLAVPANLKDNPEAQRKLAAINAALKENPLLRYNNPDLLPKSRIHHKQLEFHAIKCPSFGVKALIAANRSGKTVACVVDDIIQLVPEEFVPPHLFSYKKFTGPVTIWVGAPKNDTHFKNTIPLFRRFIPQGALIDGRFDKSFKSQPAPELKLLNGSTVAFKTYDQDLDAWAAAEVHRIHWDEEPNVAKSRELRTEAAMRLVSTEGDEIIGMTPVLGFSWVHDDVFKVRHTDPLVSVMQMGMEDNPWNTPDAIKKVEARCKTRDEYRMRIKGEFVHVGGSFFEEFNDKNHVVDPPSLEDVEDLEVVVGIDPGFRHTGITWTGFDKENSAITFAELDSTGGITQTANEIKRINLEWGVKDPVYVIDPALVIASKLGSEQVQTSYAREEIYCQGGQKDRRSGILEMKRRLGNRKPNGELVPTWVISSECPELIRQASDYRRNPDGSDEWATIPQTDTVRFDLVDSARYGLMSRVWEEADTEPSRPSYQHDYAVPFSEEQGYFDPDPAPYGDMS